MSPRRSASAPVDGASVSEATVSRVFRLALFGAVLATMVWATTLATVHGLAASGGPLEAAAATFWNLVPLAFVLCGTLIVRRHPSNWVGWILLVPGFAVLQELMPILHSAAPPTSVGVFDIAQVWFDNISWMLLIFPVFHLLVVFPDGRLLSPRWKLFVGLEVAMVGALGVLALLSEEIGPLDGQWTVANPIGLVSFRSFDGVFDLLWAAGLTILTSGALVAVALRFRRGTRAESQQIKWLFLAVSVFAVTYISISANEAWQGQGAFDLLLVLSLIGIPSAIVIAVTRYRLYEIDRIISRTVAYVLIVSLLGLVYGALVAAIGSLFDESLVVALSTLVVAALFTPLRRRIQIAVDRKFNRSRFDVERIIERFARSASDRVEPGGLVDEWLDVVGRTMGPERVAVWIRTAD